MMKSYWDLTEHEQAERLKLIDTPLSLGGIQEAFRQPASYAELRLAASAISAMARAEKAEGALETLRRDVCAERCRCCIVNSETARAALANARGKTNG